MFFQHTVWLILALGELEPVMKAFELAKNIRFDSDMAVVTIKRLHEEWNQYLAPSEMVLKCPG